MTTPPIKLKQSAASSSASSAAAAAAASQDARLLVRETMRISANLATSSSPIAAGAGAVSLQSEAVVDETTRFGLVEGQFVDSSLRLICSEDIDGRRWNYVAERDGSGSYKKNSFRAVSLQSPQAPAEVTFSFNSIIIFNLFIL